MPIKNKFTIGAYFHEPLNNEGGGVVAPVFDSSPAISRRPFRTSICRPRCGTTRLSWSGSRSASSSASASPRNEQSLHLPRVPHRSVRLRRLGAPADVRSRRRVAGASEVVHRRKRAPSAFPGRSAFTFRFTQLRSRSRFSCRRRRRRARPSSQATDTTFGFGFKWSPTDKISVGGVYKQGPEFETSLFYADSASQFNLSEVGQPSFHIPDIADSASRSARSRC